MYNSTKLQHVKNKYTNRKLRYGNVLFNYTSGWKKDVFRKGSDFQLHFTLTTSNSCDENCFSVREEHYIFTKLQKIVVTHQLS